MLSYKPVHNTVFHSPEENNKPKLIGLMGQ
jgi:hypothetical protein